MKKFLVLAALIFLLVPGVMRGQNAPLSGPTQVQMTQGIYYQIPISATSAAVNTQATLTIPAPPPNLYNYVCFLAFNHSADASGATVAATDAVTTSTNFGGFALKYSVAVGNNGNYDWQMPWGTPQGGGCAKSTSPGTATTFVSPAINAHAMYTWYGTYYQGF